MAEEKTKDVKKQKQAKPAKQAKGAAAAEKAEGQPKPKKEPRPKGPSMLEKKYVSDCIPSLMSQFGYKNRMQVPVLKQIVVNTSMKEALQDIKVLETAASEIAQITGQKPVITRAKKSIANFKLRKGQAVGARVSLRGRTMYEFMYKLVNVALPRVRDFKGVNPNSFDGRGNYTLGLTEQIIFPEINFDKVTKVNGMNITFITSAPTDSEGRALLASMGMPFRAA